MKIDLIHGDWQDFDLGDPALLDSSATHMITDPPYSPRTDAGFRSGSAPTEERGIGYPYITKQYAVDFVSEWHEAIAGWWVIFGDHITAEWWRYALDLAGFYVFHPVPWVKTGAPPRFTGDGPASGAEYITVARPRGGCPQRWGGAWSKWGSLPPWYQAATVRALHSEHAQVTGQKPIDLMRTLIRDYSRPGDTIVDPHAGSGTTLIAARQEGRSALGFERYDKHFEIAGRRLDEPYTPDMFGGAA